MYSSISSEKVKSPISLFSLSQYWLQKYIKLRQAVYNKGDLESAEVQEIIDFFKVDYIVTEVDLGMCQGDTTTPPKIMPPLFPNHSNFLLLLINFSFKSCPIHTHHIAIII